MKRILFLLALAALLPARYLYALNISVYHTSDVHGWYSSHLDPQDKDSDRYIGGFAALSALVKQDKNPHLLLDSGDTFQGTPEGNVTKGMASVKLMNQLGYSAVAVGNHDFDYGEDNLKVLISSSTFPWLAANVYLKSDGTAPKYLKPYRLVTVGGKKIAIIGLAGGHTATSTMPTLVRHLEFRNEASEAAYWTREVKRLDNPDAVIILAHIGFGADLVQKADISTMTYTPEQTGYGTLSIARAAKGANVVIGGHNHVGLLKGYLDPESGVMIAESGWGLSDVSRITLHFDDATGRYMGARDELIPLWTELTGEDPEVKQTIKTLGASVDKAMSVVLGSSEVDLGYGETPDSPIGNWLTDAIRRQTGADMVFQNTAGIRSGMKKGPIRMREVYQVMPFENTLVKLKMTGAQIRKLIEDNFRGNRSRIQMSGLRVRYKLSANGALAGLSLDRDGKPVPPAAIYTVATNNYLLNGGTGGAAFRSGSDIFDTMQPMRDILIKDIKANSPITMPAGGRFLKVE